MAVRKSFCPALVLCLLTPLLLLPCQPLLAGKPLPEVASPAVVGQAQHLAVVPDLSDAPLIGDHYQWQRTITVKEAAFLKPHFVNVNLRAGDALKVRSATGKLVEEITARGPRQAGTFWGLSAFGDTLVLELSFRAAYSEHPFQIDQVIVGDAAMLALATGDEGGGDTESICTPADFEDVICYAGDSAKWSNVMGSVGVMTVGSNPSTGLWCSGSNVSPQSYVLTNYHCIGSASDCTNAEFVFKYYRTGCNNGSPATVDWQSFRCNEVVASSSLGDCDATPTTLDFTLNSVIGDPAATFGYVTPDPTPLTAGEAIYIIQHPAGRPHEIAHGANVTIDGSTIRYYDTLDTEGGSSGSPIFREADDKMVGLHHCGGCSTAGVGNRGMMMSDIYPIIQPFLCEAAVSLVADAYSGFSEVAGNGDTVLDPGETWQLTPVLRNLSCATAATNVTAEVVVNAGSATPVTVLDSQVSFGTIAAGASASALSPVRFRLGTALSCDAEVVLDLVNISADAGGPFADVTAYLDETLGEVPVTTLLFEDFGAGLPATWSVIDGGTGTGDAATWTDANPNSRNLSLTEPFMIADSDALGSGATMDDELITPLINATGQLNVTLQLAHDFKWYSSGGNEQGDIDVRSTATGGAWVTVANFSGTNASGIVMIDITAQAAGQNDVQIRFHYYDAVFDWWWAIDDVSVLGDVGHICSPLGLAMPERFEGYADTTDLAGIWFDTVSTPEQTLATGIPNNGGGAKAMALAYDVSAGESGVRASFAEAQDWSLKPSLFWWFSGDAANSDDPVSLVLVDSSAATCEKVGGSATQAGWNQVQIDLQTDCSGIDLSAVTAVDLMVRQGSGIGSGTIWIDDLTFDGSVPVELETLSVE